MYVKDLSSKGRGCDASLGLLGLDTHPSKSGSNPLLDFFWLAHQAI